MNKQALAILAMAVVVGASAANLTWVGGSEGDWNTATNWDPQQVPTNSDTVFFDSSERITVNLGATQVFATLSVSNTPCINPWVLRFPDGEMVRFKGEYELWKYALIERKLF